MLKSIEQILKISADRNLPFWEVILRDDMNDRLAAEEESFGQMRQMYQAMKDADASYDAALRSASGLVGGDGEKVRLAREQGKLLSGDFLGAVIERALKMGESNACMKRVVAAPTAGSCGVIPAVFISVQEKQGYSDEEMTRALYVAAGIGGVIAERASISGAAGGCQAEIGASSAMAAGGVVYLQGGDAEQIAHAAAISLKNLLGLVCDPVAGLVEVPCVKRNVIGAVNAISAADLALAGVRSQIPADEVIDAMGVVGRQMVPALRETGEGGLAASPTGVKVKEKLRG